MSKGTNQSAFFLRDSAPSGPRHPSCCLLQDSGCDNFEKDLRVEFSELQGPVGVLLKGFFNRTSSVSLVHCRRPSVPSQISASQPMEADITGR